MAEATRKTELVEVTKTVTVTEPVETITLTLNKMEAELVATLVGRLGGHNGKPYRVAAGDIFHALLATGAVGDRPDLVGPSGSYASFKVKGEQ